MVWVCVGGGKGVASVEVVFVCGRKGEGKERQQVLK